MVGFGAAILGNLARFTVDSLITFVILFFLFREGKDWAYRAGRLAAALAMCRWRGSTGTSPTRSSPTFTAS